MCEHFQLLSKNRAVSIARWQTQHVLDAQLIAESLRKGRGKQVRLTLRRPLKCLLTAVAPMLPPDLVIKALTSSLVTNPEALMASEGVGSFLMVASCLMAGAAASSDLIGGSCACKMVHSSMMNKLEEAFRLFRFDMFNVLGSSWDPTDKNEISSVHCEHCYKKPW